jgi:hypothetical protein
MRGVTMFSGIAKSFSLFQTVFKPYKFYLQERSLFAWIFSGDRVGSFESEKNILEGHLFHKFKPTDTILYIYIYIYIKHSVTNRKVAVSIPDEMFF